MSDKSKPALGTLVRLEWICPSCFDRGYCDSKAGGHACPECWVPLCYFLTMGMPA